jgi:ubiquitin carboxyl-terminal hydrolase 9/13
MVQALYYSVPFREHVVRYPPLSPHSTPNGQPKIIVPIRAPVVQNGAATAAAKAKGLTAAEALKKRAVINAGGPAAAAPGQRPEDKPDSPEYKKKHAMIAGPVLEMTYDNASSYGMEESTFTGLKDIFMALVASTSRSGVLSPQRFLEIFKRDNEMFRTSMHQDAHEFYGLVLNSVIANVEANAQRRRELEPPHDDHALSQSMNAAASAMGLTGGARSPGTGWVHEIFEGVLTSETRCLTCETASQRDETFLDLSIDLEEHSSVTSCLRKFSAEEMLCERNKFHCDNCGGLQEAEKRMKIKRLPKILALHLKRFKYTEDMTRLQKLFHRVVYPYHLRMFNTTDDAEDPDRLYELYAVVVHIGGNAYHGHYVSVIKTKDRGWLLFDDEMVEPVDKHYVRNFFGDKPGQACAYVLFYQETTVEAMRKEQEDEGLAEAALQEAGVALGNTQSNGISPTSPKPVTVLNSPSNPYEEPQEYVSLNTVISNPLPTSPELALRPPPGTLTHASTLPILGSSDAEKRRSKEERAREQKENKEAEKARKAASKAAEKERVKEAERRRKELEQKRKDYARNQADEIQKAIQLSKASAAEEDQKRKGPEAAVDTFAVDETDSSHHEKDKLFGRGTLSRSHKGSKSVGRRSFGFLGKQSGEKEKFLTRPDKAVGDDQTFVEGDPGPLPIEKHEKPVKDGRFSFSGLGRKKSGMFSSG